MSLTERFVDMAPGLPLIIPHLGTLGGNPMDFLKAFKDKSHIYFDTALAAKSTIQKFVETIGPERVLFAADVPFGNMPSELSKVLALTIPDSDKELILSKNIIRLARLSSLGAWVKGQVKPSVLSRSPGIRRQCFGWSRLPLTLAP